MPPKKKKAGKKGKKGGKGKSDDASGDAAKPNNSEPTEKELILKAELEAVTEELGAAKKRVEDLRRDNEWLQQEAQQIRIETHEYMSYMEKKTSKRQTTIVTLSDHNKQEIQNIEDQKKNISAEFDDKKSKLKATMLEKQHILEKAKKELENMQELKALQQSQTSRIKELEAKITDKRAANALRVSELKSQFLEEKKQCQEESDDKIQALKNQANKEALKCLTEHTNSIKKENRELREQLMGYIHQTRVLQEHRDNLEDQRKQLLREQQYTEDMRALRNAKLHKCGLGEEGKT